MVGRGFEKSVTQPLPPYFDRSVRRGGIRDEGSTEVSLQLAELPAAGQTSVAKARAQMKAVTSSSDGGAIILTTVQNRRRQASPTAVSA